jgi:ubiquinone/menaquinone biosynthesis C-methylase UbiE
MESSPGSDHSRRDVDYTNSRRHLLRVFTTPAAIKVRKRVYETFLSTMAPTAGTTVVDIGITADQTTEDSNFFEKWYPHPGRVTATSIEDASYVEAAHPGVTFVRTTADELPFEDRQFDIAFSSAVLEHVGDRARQRRFLEELLRVSERFFVVTPDRRFPIELHTFLPFLHWMRQDRHQRVLRSLGQSAWAETDNLNLLDETSLRALFPVGVRPTVTGPRMFGLRSNLVAFGQSIPGPTSGPGEHVGPP